MNLHIRWCRNQNYGFFPSLFSSARWCTYVDLIGENVTPDLIFSVCACRAPWDARSGSFMQWLRSWMSWLWVLDYPSVSRHTPHYGSEPCLTLWISNSKVLSLPLQYHWPSQSGQSWSSVIFPHSYDRPIAPSFPNPWPDKIQTSSWNHSNSHSLIVSLILK